MREIKFRAYDKDDKVMRSWNELILEKDKGDNFYLLGYEKNKVETDYDHDQVLMQYTGLTDKNGTEIYEGDVCKTVISSGSPLGTLDVVKYCNGGFKLVDIEDRLLPINFDNSDIISIEIIGNVFQNGELLHDS